MNQSFGMVRASYGLPPSEDYLKSIPTYEEAGAPAGEVGEVTWQKDYGGGGTTAGGVMDFIGNIIGAGADIVSGVTGVKAAKANAAAVIENARAQWMTAAIQYKESALNAKLAPIIAAEQSKVALAEAKARTRIMVFLGGGAILATMFGLFLFAPQKKRKGRKKR
jgi:hypothetical protein